MSKKVFVRKRGRGSLTIHNHVSQVQPSQDTSRSRANDAMKHKDSHENSICRPRAEYNSPIGADRDCGSDHLCTEFILNQKVTLSNKE